jgi:hypothetical protein
MSQNIERYGNYKPKFIQTPLICPVATVARCRTHDARELGRLDLDRRTLKQHIVQRQTSRPDPAEQDFALLELWRFYEILGDAPCRAW